MLSVVIPTIGRSTLNNAIESVLSEGLLCIVINDGIEMRPPCPQPGLTYLRLGRNYGRMDDRIWYGQIAFTVGVLISSTQFCMGIGDDDELTPGAGRLIESAITREPDVDIWVPAIEYAGGHTVCNEPELGVVCGNVSHMAYRSTLFSREPMIHRPDDNLPISDYLHAKRCEAAGYKFGWVGQTCVKIRPHLDAWHGRGQDA